VEACIPPRPIARAHFWDKVIDTYYHELTWQERSRLHDWITRSSLFDINNQDCAIFEARYNPQNQYLVKTIYNEKEEHHECFLYNENYHVSKNTRVDKAFIISECQSPDIPLLVKE
jgi:hypothetical protein